MVALAVVFAAAWALMGPACRSFRRVSWPIAFWVSIWPARSTTAATTFSQVIDHMAYGNGRHLRHPDLRSSTYIFLFILFGAFLEKAGMIRLFNDVSLQFGRRQARRSREGGDHFFGPDGPHFGFRRRECRHDGQFTIPLMKKFGYRAAFAGAGRGNGLDGRADHAPVMGAVAFIMAETLGVEYYEIVKRRSYRDPLFRVGLLDRPSRSRQVGRSPAQGTAAFGPRRQSSNNGI